MCNMYMDFVERERVSVSDSVLVCVRERGCVCVRLLFVTNYEYQKKVKKIEMNVVYHTRTYANVRIRPPNWTYANIRNYGYS